MKNPLSTKGMAIVIAAGILFFFCVTMKFLFDMAFYESMENKRTELYDTAKYINAQTDNKISSLRLLLVDAEISMDNKAEIDRVLPEIYRLGCFAAKVYDTNGRLITEASLPNAAVEGIDDIRAFQEAGNGVGAVSGKIDPAVPGDSYVVFNVPIFGPNSRLRGTLAAYVFWSDIDREVNAFYSDQGQYYFLMDMAGRVVSIPDHCGYPDLPMGENLLESVHTPVRPNDFFINLFRWEFSDLSLYSNLEYSSWKLVKVMSVQALCREILWTGLPYLLLLFAGNIVFGAAYWFIYQQRNKRNLLEKMQMERLTSATRVAAGIAHEIKNPLTSIKGFMQVMMRKDKEKVFENYLSIALKEVERIELLISQFSALARPLSKEAYVAVNLYDIVSELVFFVRPIALEKKIEVVFLESAAAENAAQPFFVLGCANQLKQVVINLMKNAIEASPPDCCVTIRLWHEEKNVLLRISDYGIGIPSENLQKIGTPFFTTKENGTGLGLLISFEIVRRHGGQIKITSGLQKGTDFTVCFPAGDAV